MDGKELALKVRELRDNIEKVIVGKSTAVENLLVGFLSGGHVLIEDIPGVGKTVLAKSLARSVEATFKRVQFTPDILPQDVTGTFVFNQKEGDFYFKKGPIFTNILLADEINRGSPRTQSALLEAMEERQVTVEGERFPLPSPFFVVGTQNPVEHYGIYPLPEAELDRFTMRISMGYPAEEEEVKLLKDRKTEDPLDSVSPVMSLEEVSSLIKAVREVEIEDSVYHYMVRLVNATRTHPSVILGGSPRSTLHLMRTSQVWAVLEGRNYVIPEDVKKMALLVLPHRLLIKGKSKRLAVELVASVIKEVPAI